MSSSVLKTSEFSRVSSTSENFDVFNSLNSQMLKLFSHETKPAFKFCKIDEIQYISRYCKNCFCQAYVYNITRTSHIQGMYHGADHRSGGLAVWNCSIFWSSSLDFVIASELDDKLASIFKDAINIKFMSVVSSTK